MPTPTKPIGLVVMDGKSHRTKAEIEQRKEAEAELFTGQKMKMWPGMDKAGKTEFERVRLVLASIGKDDALYESVINRYAQLKSECKKYEIAIKKLRTGIKEAEERLHDGEIEYLDYMTLTQKLYANINACDRQIQAKRKMMLDIEKENIMTIASALRSVPKKVQKDTPKSGMAAFMNKRTGGGA